MDLNHALLDAAEEARLLCLAQAGDETARAELVEKNQLLVRWRALKFFHSRITGDCELDDLVQWGNIGLLRAIPKWDAGQGKRFSTYAVWWIDESIRRQGMLSGSALKLSYRDSTRLLDIRKARARLLQALGREPEAGEIAAEAGLPTDFVAGVLETIIDGVSRLDTPMNGRQRWGAESGEGSLKSIVELLPDPGMGPAERAEQRAVAVQIQAALRELSAREREIIRRRYWCTSPDTLVAIAKDLRIPYQYVQQLEQRALEKLREQSWFQGLISDGGSGLGIKEI